MNLITRIRRASVQEKCFLVFIAACVLPIALVTLERFSFAGIWDDGYFFARYADNLLAYGKIAWNPGGEPTYGLSSPLFLVIVTPIRMLVPNSPVLVGWLASFISGVAFIVLLFALALSNVEKNSRWLVIGLVSFTLAQAATTLTVHLTNGMDTAFAMAFLTGYFILLKRHTQSASRASALALGALGALAFWVRPDLMFYTVLVPATILCFDPQPQARSHARWILAVTVAATLVELALSGWLLGSPLPLPFYAKGTQLYGDFIYAEFKLTAAHELYNFLQSYWLFFFVIGLHFSLDFIPALRKLPSVEKGILLSSILFIAYYLFFTLQVMGGSGRFYHPTLPGFALLAAQSAVELKQRLPAAIRDIVWSAPSRLWIAATVLSILPLVPIVVDQVRTLRAVIASGRVARFDQRDPYQVEGTRYMWYHAADFSALPDDLVIAATETGRIGAMNPRKTIIDLAGLHTLDFAHPPFSAALLFAKYKPDLIYMPYRDYREMIAQIKSDPHFIQSYDYLDEDELNANLGVAIWRESKYYSAMRQILRQGKAQ